jgi:predicted  nucleic acid-binding Zn-ribbon protein
VGAAPAGHRTRLRPADLSTDQGSATLKAAASDQQRLLDVQALDTRLDQLAHRRETLPEHAALRELDTTLAALRDQLVNAETEASDINRELTKAEGDVDQVRARAVRDQQRLDAGQVSSPKELEGLQHEITTLARRQGDLEDVVLEIMERLESTQSLHSELLTQQERTKQRAAELTAARDTATAEIDAEASRLRPQRDTQAGQLADELMALYEKIRAQQAGIGAAELKARRCSGCRLEINNVELARLRAAADDEVLRCEECRRILVRTAESGL